MNYKPEESKLIAYIYGELSEADKKEVEEYLSGNAEAKKELEELKATISILATVKDQEVDVPRFTFNQASEVVVGQKTIIGFWKKSLAIAASISLIFLIGYLTNIRISFGDQGFELSFNEHSGYSPQNVESMIANAIQENNQKIAENLSSSEVSLRKMIDENQNDIKTKLVGQSFSSNEDQLAQQRKEFMDLFRKMIESSELDQKKYTDEVLLDFAVYLDIQRQSDLEVIQTRFNSLEDNAELNLFQTNRILSDIMTSKEPNHY